MVTTISRKAKMIVTVEDGTLEGGFGSAVLEALETAAVTGVKVHRIGLPDKFVEHGRRDELFAKYGLTPDAICDVINRSFQTSAIGAERLKAER